MGFCKRKNVECKCLSEASTCNSDNCYRNLPDKTTFKQELTDKADLYEKAIDISEDIEYIKERMNYWCSKREYTIHLIRSKGPMAIGDASSNVTSRFIPKLLSPEYYRKLFVDEFKKLGFKETDMELSSRFTDLYDSYDIELTW